jgi:hypothetical protein
MMSGLAIPRPVATRPDTSRHVPHRILPHDASPESLELSSLLFVSHHLSCHNRARDERLTMQRKATPGDLHGASCSECSRGSTGPRLAPRFSRGGNISLLIECPKMLRMASPWPAVSSFRFSQDFPTPVPGEHAPLRRRRLDARSSLHELMAHLTCPPMLWHSGTGMVYESRSITLLLGTYHHM